MLSGHMQLVHRGPQCCILLQECSRGLFYDDPRVTSHHPSTATLKQKSALRDIGHQLSFLSQLYVLQGVVQGCLSGATQAIVLPLPPAAYRRAFNHQVLCCFIHRDDMVAGPAIAIGLLVSGLVLHLLQLSYLPFFKICLRPYYCYSGTTAKLFCPCSGR